MTRYGTLAATVAATAMLAGCGGGGGGETGTTKPPKAADPAKTLAQVYNDGKILNATHTTAARIDTRNGTVEGEKWAEFSVQGQSATNDFWLTLGGLTNMLTDEERSEDWIWQWESMDDPGMYFECWTCPDATWLWATHAGRRIAASANQFTNGFAIIGLPTANFDNVPVRATYQSVRGSQGRFGAILYMRPAENYDIEDREVYFGDTALVADFTNQTLSGRLFNFEDEDGELWSAFKLEMPETTFNTEGFSGHFDVSGVRSGVSSLAYEGSFYGPEAQEIGGVISGTVVGGGNSTIFLTTGMFAGTQ